MIKKRINWYLVVIAVVTAVGLFFARESCVNFDLKEQLNQQLMKANEKLGRAETKFGDAQKKIDELSQQIQAEIKERNAIATRYAELEAELKDVKKQKQKVKVVYREGPTITVPQELDLVKGLLYQAVDKQTLKEILRIPGEYQDFRLKIHVTVEPVAEQLDVEFNFQYELGLRVKLKLIETLTPTGAINHYAELFELDKNGNEVNKLRIEDFEVITRRPENKTFHWFNPKLDIGATLNVRSTLNMATGSSLGVSLMSYGLTRSDLMFKFARVGVGFSDGGLELQVSPVSWNVAKNLPLLDNLWITPYVGKDVTSPHYSGGVVFGVSL